MAEALPQTLGRYTPLRLLGEGGQGRVFEAMHHLPGGLQRRVALKVLFARGEELHREARLGGLLRHPHLVDVYEVGQHQGSWFCAMELCEGGSLADRGPLSPRAVVEVGLQVCDALGYAHEELELVHLDLKPANLLLRDGAVKVADLGVATARGFEGDGRVRGTPRFMAPEQRLGLPLDARADIYALGVVLVELATGAQGDRTVTLGDELPAEPPPSLAWLEPVIERCTAPDARDRFASMRELARALAALAVDGPSLVEQLGAVSPQVPSDPGSNLGDALDRCYGRDGLLRAVGELLETPGPVTLKGPAGIGKTRLAREAGRCYRQQTGQEAWFVDLTLAKTEGELVQRLAHLLELPLRGPFEACLRQLGDAIAGRGPLLLVLDGFEHLLEHRHVVERWVERAPEARLLLTSQIPLRLAAERIVEVPPLDEPAAVALLAGRALQRGVEVGRDPLLPELARRLDGVPLALELAAGRLGVLSVGEVLERLDLSLLRSGRLGLSRRQATLRGALDGSWELLAEREQAALAQLSVFRGGFGPDDAAAVLALPGEALEALAVLSEHSLLASREGRLDLLAPVSAYASERLAERQETAATEQRHARWFARYGADAALRAMAGPAQARLLRERAADLANLAEAVQRAVASGEGALAARAALGAASVLRERGPIDDGIALLTQALPICPAALCPELLLRRAAMRVDAGRLAEAEEDLEAACALAPGDLALLARVERERGRVHLERAELEAAGQHFARSLELCERQGTSPGRALLCLSAVHLQLGSLELAERTSRQAIAELRRVGDRAHEASALGNLSIALRLKGLPDEARELCRQALAIDEQLGARGSMAADHANLAILEAYAGRLEQAREHFETSIALCRACGARSQEALQIGNLAELHLQLGALDEARRCGEAALSAHREFGNLRLEGRALQLLARVALLEEDRAAGRALLEAALARFLEARTDIPAAGARLELARLDLEEGAPAAALDRLEPALVALEGDVVQQAWAWAVRGEARAALGATGPAREDLDNAVSTLRSLSPPLAVLALCAAARALGDSAPLAEALALAEAGIVRPGSPGHRELERTRRQLS